MRDYLPRRLKPPIGNRRLLLLGIALAIAIYRFHFQPRSSEPPIEMIELQKRPSPAKATAPAGVSPSIPEDSCTEWKGCFTGIVSGIADGDTLSIRSAGRQQRVRLVLVDAPERDTPAGPAATELLAALCGKDSPATVYPDLNQPQDEYGRTLGVVYCDGVNANAAMIRSGRAKLFGRFCRGSVFGSKVWARELGCRD